MRLSELETPALVLERARLERNIARMREHMAPLKVNLRPHVKTAKSIDVVRRALDGQRGGIAVSTLAEAEYFFGHGVKDILYAVGIAPNKLAHVADLRRRGADITVTLDNPDAAAALAADARRYDTEFPALIEIDSDGHRSGVQPGDPRLVQIARMLDAGPATRMRGVMTHAGDSYNSRSTAAITAMAERERAAVVSCAETLARAGLPCPVVSVGSTPTATFAQDLAGVTEVR
ncbi:MAG: alanine racemase, partial [Betaproteobacteria bacterium]|nr:alanine racemase [Betaproteobacteria bacterium]